MRARVHVLFAAALAAGCAPATSPAPDAALAGDLHFPRDWVAAPALYARTGVKAIDVLGDVHGDPEAAVEILAAAGLVGAAPPHRWTGGARILVVTGDVIDKGTRATKAIDLLAALEREARAAGGDVVVTLGNHEAEFLADPMGQKSRAFQAELMSIGLDPARVAAGETRYGEWLRTLPVAALIDDWFLCHGGDTGEMSAEEIGKKFRKLFEGARARAPYDDDFLLGGKSLLEASAWWLDGGGLARLAKVEANLKKLPAKHVVFGHDPGDLDFPGDPLGDRARGTLAARYGGRLFLVDVGMSYAVGYAKGALLRITRDPDEAIALSADGKARRLWP